MNICFGQVTEENPSKVCWHVTYLLAPLNHFKYVIQYNTNTAQYLQWISRIGHYSAYVPSLGFGPVGGAGLRATWGGWSFESIAEGLSPSPLVWFLMSRFGLGLTARVGCWGFFDCIRSSNLCFRLVIKELIAGASSCETFDSSEPADFSLGRPCDCGGGGGGYNGILASSSYSSGLCGKGTPLCSPDVVWCNIRPSSTGSNRSICINRQRWSNLNVILKCNSIVYYMYWYANVSKPETLQHIQLTKNASTKPNTFQCNQTNII